MTQWIQVASVADIPDGKWKPVEVDLISLLVINRGGCFYAIENICTHDGASLDDGCVEGDEIICPRHGARFCIKTGAVTKPPAYEDLKVYPIRVIEDKVEIGLDDLGI